MRTLHLSQNKVMWLVGKKILHRLDIKQPADLLHCPRLKADIITRFMKKTGFMPGDNFTTYLDGIIQHTPMEYNLHCKLLALKWTLCDIPPRNEDDKEQLEYFRIDHFYRKRLGVSIYLFPDYTPGWTLFDQLMNMELEKEELSSEDFREYVEALQPYLKLMDNEYSGYGRLGLVSAVFKWRDMQSERILSQVGVTHTRACTSCKRNQWKLRARKFGVYLKCTTLNCRGIQEVHLPAHATCNLCGQNIDSVFGVGGKKIYVCRNYPTCSSVSAG